MHCSRTSFASQPNCCSPTSTTSSTWVRLKKGHPSHQVGTTQCGIAFGTIIESGPRRSSTSLCRIDPAVVVAVEGQTEAAVFPRVFELFGISENSGLIQIVNRESIKGNIRLLARAFAVPRLDPDGYRGFRLRSHATGLFLPVDPEGPSKTPADRETQRQTMIEEILRSVPHVLRTTALRDDLEHLVHVVAWGDEPFEYAHFTDRELAQALRRIAGSAAPDLKTLQGQISILRRSGANLEKVWRRWPVAIGKPELVDSLWPVLERRLRARRPARPAPIKGVAEQIVDLAHRIRSVRELGVES